MEIAPAAIAIPVLIWIYPRYRFTTLAYVLIARQDRAIARLDVATAAPAPVS